MIVKYQLEHRTTPTGTGLTTPESIDDGGYFPDRDGSIIGYSDGTQPLGTTCIEITEAELEERKARLINTQKRLTVYEYAIRSDGQCIYVGLPSDNINGCAVAKTFPSKDTVYHYSFDDKDSSCEFYSERSAGRKKYWSNTGSNSIPTERYSRPDSDNQILTCYSEIAGVTQEWYYEFIKFEKMMAFVSANKPISLPPKLEAKLKDDPISTRASYFLHDACMYSASLEVTAAGAKITTIYVRGTPEDVLLTTP